MVSAPTLTLKVLLEPGVPCIKKAGCRRTEMVHEEVKRGTKTIRYLLEDLSEFLEERRLKDMVKKHSEFIGYPIELYVEKSKEEEVIDSE